MKINKDLSIVELLDRLELHKRGWCIRDYWEADLCAIGISNSLSSDRLAYVSTYELKAGRYNCECERRNRHSPLGYDTVFEGQDLSFDELVAILARHLHDGGVAQTLL